jgi:hypothetical protein
VPSGYGFGICRRRMMSLMSLRMRKIMMSPSAGARPLAMLS